LTRLHPTPDEKANADFLVADYDYKQWDSKAGDSGQNRTFRQSAESALMGFYAGNKNNSAAAKFSLQAAYEIAHMKKTVSDPAYHAWFKTTTAAWNFLNLQKNKEGKSDALQPPFSDYGAEAEYTLLDEEIAQKWDNGVNRKQYCGSLDEVLGKFDAKSGQRQTQGLYTKDAELADKYDKELEKIARTYPSVEWVPATIARQGSLYDGLRTGLYNTTTGNKSCFQLFTKQQEGFLKQMENSGRDDLADKADQLRTAAKEGWRNKKESELAGSDTLMVRRYATAVHLAKKYNVRNASVSKAIAKLAYYTDIIGDAKMREYVTGTVDPTNAGTKLSYTDGMYVQSRPGLTSTPAQNGSVPPLPVAP
jgi:hypothetical protein